MSAEKLIPTEEAVVTEQAATGSVTDIFSMTNSLLVIVIVYLVYKVLGKHFRKREEEEEPFVVPPPLPKHDMTLEELSKYNGKGSDKRVCIAILGRVYDCSKSYHFYGPGSPYGTFAGHDATRAFAKFDVMAVKEEWDDVSDLTASEMSSVEEWKEQFDEKYDYVGQLIRSTEENADTSNASSSSTAGGEGDSATKPSQQEEQLSKPDEVQVDDVIDDDDEVEVIDDTKDLQDENKE